MRRIVPLLLLLAALIPPGTAPASEPRPPMDYSDVSALSAPVYEALVHERVSIQMNDGVRLYGEVTRPAVDGRFGTIVVLSPYHDTVSEDRSGSGTLPRRVGGLVGYFPPRGYAVLVVDVRGTANSEGCLDYLGARDRRDFHDVVEWAAGRPWSNGRVGIIGVSYVGSTPIAAAAANPPHLTTIVPIAGLAQMYDHQFQAGVPYFLQWVGPLEAYETIAAVPPQNRDDPGWARNVASAGCGAPNGAAATGADFGTGRYVAWHRERDHRAAAIASPVPMFLVQGHTDKSVRPIAMEWFTRRGNPKDKLWLGQWGHQASDRGDQWIGAVHRWFDRHLQERDVDTGPPVEVFLNPAFGPVLTGTSWPPARTATVTLYPAGEQLLASSPPEQGSFAFAASAARAVVQRDDNPSQLVFRTAPLDEPLVLTGFPSVTLRASVSGGRVDLMASLYDVGGFQPRLITHASINPELRNGIETFEPVVPGEIMTLRPPAWPMNHLLEAGHRLQLVVSSSHSDKVPVFAGPGIVTVYTGPGGTSVEVPVAVDPLLWPDPALG